MLPLYFVNLQLIYLFRLFFAPFLNDVLSFPTLQSKKALTNILQKCVHLPALEPLLKDAPPNILKHVVSQFAKVLPHDVAARRLFVTSGSLRKIQEINAEGNTALSEHINTINNCYPEEIVKWAKHQIVLYISLLSCLRATLVLLLEKFLIKCRKSKTNEIATTN